MLKLRLLQHKEHLIPPSRYDTETHVAFTVMNRIRQP